MKFKLLKGTHSLPGKDAKVYKKGEVIETNIDLVAQFGKTKFECCDSTPAKQTKKKSTKKSTSKKPVYDAKLAADYGVEVKKDGNKYQLFQDGDALTELLTPSQVQPTLEALIADAEGDEESSSSE